MSMLALAKFFKQESCESNKGNRSIYRASNVLVKSVRQPCHSKLGGFRLVNTYETPLGDTYTTYEINCIKCKCVNNTLSESFGLDDKSPGSYSPQLSQLSRSSRSSGISQHRDSGTYGSAPSFGGSFMRSAELSRSQGSSASTSSECCLSQKGYVMSPSHCEQESRKSPPFTFRRLGAAAT